jgi:AraC-like DNA-binding protein
MYRVNKHKYVDNYHFTGAIQSLIECVFIENYFSRAENQWVRNRIVPDNTLELVLTDKKFKREFSNRGESQVLRSHFTGLKTQWQDIWVEDSPLLSIRFKPEVMYQLTSIPAVEFKNRAIHPIDVFGPNFVHFEDELFSLRSIDDRLSLINTYFSSLMNKVKTKNDPVFYSAKYSIERNFGSVRIHHLAHQLGISQKGLENKFKRFLGVTPKEYCRLNRFIGSVKNYQTSEHSLTGWAYDNDYSDQSHLIKEFKHFTGTCPSAYFSDSKGIQEGIL